MQIAKKLSKHCEKEFPDSCHHPKPGSVVVFLWYRRYSHKLLTVNNHIKCPSNFAFARLIYLFHPPIFEKILMQIRSILFHSEFGEIDSDMVKTAVKTFVHSCAGYSVATYVLVSMHTHVLRHYSEIYVSWSSGRW